MTLESRYKNPEHIGVDTQPAIVFTTPKIDVELLRRYSWTIPLMRKYAHKFPLFALRDIPIPHPEMVPGGQLYQVLYSGVCGSDRKLVHMDIGLSALDDVPGGVLKRFTLGHEIVAMDEDGQVGVIYTLNSCLKFGELDSTNASRYCEPCKAGNHNLCEHRKIGPSRGLAIGAGEVTERSEDQGAGHTRSLVVHATRFIPLPQGYPPDKIPLAVLTDAISCGMNAEEIARKKAGVEKSDRILIVGGGMIGFSAALALTHFGYTDISLLAKYKFQAELAQRLGINIFAFEDHPGRNEGLEDSFRAVFECAGTNQSLTDSLRFAKPQGDIIELGLPQDVELDNYYPSRKQVDSHRAFWSALPHCQSALDAIMEILVHKFAVGDLVNHNYSLFQAREAFFHRGNVLKNAFSILS